MKKNRVLLFLLMMTMWSFAEDVKIIRVMTDGREVAEYYPADTETLTIFDSASNGYRTQDIRGLENLKNLKVLDFCNGTCKMRKNIMKFENLMCFSVSLHVFMCFLA